MGATRVLASKRARSGCDDRPPARRLCSPPSYICDLLSSFVAQKNNYGYTRHCHEMLPLAPSIYSRRSKEDPKNSAHGFPAPKQTLWPQEAWAHSLGSLRTLRLGAQLAQGTGPGGEDSASQIHKQIK